jgi:hypothetical protein
MAEQGPDSTQTDLSLPDMRMSVDVSPERTRAIVEMEEGQAPQSYGSIHLSHQGFSFLRRAKIIAGSKAVTGIKANSKSPIVPQPFNDFLEFFKKYPD